MKLGCFCARREKVKVPGSTRGEIRDDACKPAHGLKQPHQETSKNGESSGMTPLLEAVKWNQRDLVRSLCAQGADVQALALNPYDPGETTWSALHVFAEQGHDDDLDLVDDLIAAGVPVDGNRNHSTETPLCVAVRREAFRLADKLIGCGASLNTATYGSASIVSDSPLTVLGHIIAHNRHDSSAALQYVLAPHVASNGLRAHVADFIVEPARSLSALQLCAIMPASLTDLSSGLPVARATFDWTANRAITRELLAFFRGSDYVDFRSEVLGVTALHLAAEYGNVGVVEELVRHGADKTIQCDTGETAAGLARRTRRQEEDLQSLLIWLE